MWVLKEVEGSCYDYAALCRSKMPNLQRFLQIVELQISCCRYCSVKLIGRKKCGLLVDDDDDGLDILREN